jgi:flavin reductase (DIM6/NTAB) family NADH-FMN oxidoreductase RutF
MELATSDLTYEAAYKLLIGCVVPRPIAWISTLSAQGHPNLAPFSCFTFVSSRPPMVAISIGPLKGRPKDTARNIARDKEFVVNIANMSMIDALHRSSFEFPEEVSEIEKLGLATAPCRNVRAPRLADAPISLECHLHQIIEFGEVRTRLVVGEVKRFHIRDALCKDGKVDSYALDPVARLGGPHYAALGNKVTVAAGGGTPANERNESVHHAGYVPPNPE